jgi:hypothetical protein
MNAPFSVYLLWVLTENTHTHTTHGCLSEREFMGKREGIEKNLL